jgi:ATP-dependent Clp protease, protease subunit
MKKLNNSTSYYNTFCKGKRINGYKLAGKGVETVPTESVDEDEMLEDMLEDGACVDFGEMSGAIGTLPDPVLLEYYKRLDKRVLVINCDIADFTVDLGIMIMDWNLEDYDVPVEERMPIKIYINTDGGDANSTLSLIDIIMMSKTPVYTIGLGKCYSAGSLILMAGHKRMVCPNTELLLHDGTMGYVGTAGKTVDTLSNMKKLGNKLRSFILSRTKMSEKLYDKNYRKEWYMDSDEMLQYGIADEIVTDIDTILAI